MAARETKVTETTRTTHTTAAAPATTGSSTGFTGASSTSHTSSTGGGGGGAIGSALSGIGHDLSAGVHKAAQAVGLEEKPASVKAKDDIKNVADAVKVGVLCPARF
jgi:hypothetical protein